MPATPIQPSEYEDVMPSGRSKDYLGSLGGTIAKKLGYEPGGDLLPIVERLGGKIEVRSWKRPPEDGSIKVEGPNDFTIYLSPYTGPLCEIALPSLTSWGITSSIR